MPFYRAWLSIRRLEVPDHRGRQRRRHRRRPVPRARLRHPLRRDRRQARRALRQARHARGHGRHLAAAQRGRAGPRARPAAHRPRGRGGGGAAPRPGLAGDRGRGLPRRGAGHRGRHRRHRADRDAGSPRSRWPTVATPTSSRALQWEALAQPMTLATADLQEGIAAAPREAGAGVPRALSERRRREGAPQPPTPAFPSWRRGAVGPFWAQT